MNNSKNEYKAEILLVEDNPGDIRLVQESFEEGKLRNNLSVVTDGLEAVKFLKKQGKYRNAPKPDIILLDLNLPKMDGIEVLRMIKNTTDLKRIPIVVLTTSKSEEDILKSYNLHANCYITKPVSMEEFIRIIKTFGDFWLTVVKLPEE